MPLIPNDLFEFDDKKNSVTEEVTLRAKNYLSAIKELKELDLIFLKSCGYYESIIDEVLILLGFSKTYTDSENIAKKIKILNSLIYQKDLLESTETYKKLFDTRNSVAHSYSFTVKNDRNFFKQMSLPETAPDIDIVSGMLKYFSKIYHAPMYIAVGIKFSHSASDFLVFKKDI